MVTVPVLTVDSGLKGSNLPPSGLSESSGFLSGEFCAPGAATEDADAAINSAAAAHVKNLNRLMIFLLRIPTIDFVSYCDCARATCAVPRCLLERGSARIRPAGRYRAQGRAPIDRCSTEAKDRLIPRRPGAGILQLLPRLCNG